MLLFLDEVLLLLFFSSVFIAISIYPLLTDSYLFNYMFIDLFLCLSVVVVSLFVGCTFLRVYLRIVSSLIINIISIPFPSVCKC